VTHVGDKLALGSARRVGFIFSRISCLFRSEQLLFRSFSFGDIANHAMDRTGSPFSYTRREPTSTGTRAPPFAMMWIS